MLEDLQKELQKTLKTYKSIYDSTMNQAMKQMEDLPKDEKAKFGELMGEIKQATKNLDTDKLRQLLHRVKNKT